jgi:hypothetical protein
MHCHFFHANVAFTYFTFLGSKNTFLARDYHEYDSYSYMSVLGKENFCLIHVSLVPVLGVVGEQVNNSSFSDDDEFCLLLPLS